MRAKPKLDLDMRFFSIDGNCYYAVEHEVFKNYFITTCGNVITRNSGFNGRAESVRGDSKPRLMSLPQNANGYAVITIYEGHRKSSQHYVHRLVADTFFELPESDYQGNERDQVNHINAVRHDNRVSNLEWNSSSENIKHQKTLKEINKEREEMVINDRKKKVA